MSTPAFRWLPLAALALALPALAQQTPVQMPPMPPPPASTARPVPQAEPTATQSEPGTTQPAAPQPLPPDPSRLVTEPQPPLTETPVAQDPATATPAQPTPPPADPKPFDREESRPVATPVPDPAVPAPPPPSGGAYVDGKPRYGAFLSGPGSLNFVLHHTLMGGASGLLSQAVSDRGFFDDSDRNRLLVGTFLGAGLGFGASAWYQFNHWIDQPMANLGIANSVMGSLFGIGFMELLSEDRTTLTWSGIAGAQLGAWLTAFVGGGQLPLDRALLIGSGGAWGGVYGALLLAIMHFSSSDDLSGKTWRDVLFITPAVGASALALATMRFHPTATQVLRADIFGAGVGAVLYLVSALVTGFDRPTPYVMGLLGSVGAITTVSILWDERAERGTMASASTRKGRYTSVWW